MVRKTKDPEERREEMLRAADALFHAKGFQLTTVRDIVKSVKVSQGTFYYYFKSKEELADALIGHELAQLMPPFIQLAGDESLRGIEKLKLIVQKQLMKDKVEDGIFQYLHHENNVVLHQRLIVMAIQKFGPILADVIEQGVREGDLHVEQSRAVAEFFLTGCQFWLDSAVSQPTEEEYGERIRALGGIMEALFGTREKAFDYADSRD